jgi:hypothetical protein
MDPNHETMLWYLAYIDTVTPRAGGAQLGIRTTDHGRPLRRRLARWCGHAALRVGTWLLAEEVRTGGAPVPQAPPRTGTSHP